MVGAHQLDEQEVTEITLDVFWRRVTSREGLR
jgi:hypothetical protein